MKWTDIKITFGLILIMTVISMTGCALSDNKPQSVDYCAAENWAYFGIGEGKDADAFLICPTVDTKDEWNMRLSDEETKADSCIKTIVLCHCFLASQYYF